jgi:hypothetical protein
VHRRWFKPRAQELAFSSPPVCLFLVGYWVAVPRALHPLRPNSIADWPISAPLCWLPLSRVHCSLLDKAEEQSAGQTMEVICLSFLNYLRFCELVVHTLPHHGACCDR